MPIRIAISILALAALSACAVAETHQIARGSWEDGPEVRQVIDDELDTLADAKCPRGYDVLAKERSVEEGRHVMRWSIACTR